MREARVSPADPLLAPVTGADHREVVGVTLDIVKAGAGRVKRVVYPPGFRWSSDMKHVSHTALCMHAHVGWIVRGHVQIQYGDGCVVSFAAPAAVVIEPGHDGWVVGTEPAVLIEFDFEGDTASRFGLAGAHRHE